MSKAELLNLLQTYPSTCLQQVNFILQMEILTSQAKKLGATLNFS